MSGIVFYGSQKYEDTIAFYRNKIGCEIWLEQEDCTILRHDNFLFGFCKREQISSAGIVTFFYESRKSVDMMYESLKDFAETPPKLNDKYQIYHFFASDPEGRRLEFQYFENSVEPFISAENMLISRRSIRSFKTTNVPETLLQNVIKNCRMAPSSHNHQPCYFRIIRDRNLIYKLSGVRGASSSPIAKAPVAVAIISDQSKSERHIQDGCIMAYHFLLAARMFGLGTCWIADMDRKEVKDLLDIPQDHYVATVTPVGFPENPERPAPKRKPLDYYLRNN